MMAFDIKNNTDRIYREYLTPDQYRGCAFLLDKFATAGAFSLLRQYSQLKENEKLLEEAHPLTVLSAIVSDPDLKQKVRKIKSGPWKSAWDDRIGRIFSKEREKNNLSAYTRSFSLQTGLALDVVEQDIGKGEYSRLIERLL